MIIPEQAITNHVASNTNGTVSTATDSFAEAQIIQLTHQASISIVFVIANSGERFLAVDGNYGDRNNLSLSDNGDALIRTVAAQCPQTIVVMHTVGPVLTSAWHENENVTAVLWAGLPGQESGNSIVDVLCGKYNPSGKLPITIGPTARCHKSQLLYEQNDSDNAPQQDISGLDNDYRHFEAKNITPAFEFGFGLSYTSFQYSDLNVTMLQMNRFVPDNSLMGKAPQNEVNSAANYPDYLFPPTDQIPHLEGYVYPYLSDFDPKKPPWMLIMAFHLINVLPQDQLTLLLQRTRQQGEAREVTQRCGNR